MNRINPDIDIVADLLQAVIQARPTDEFCRSLLHQYQERGGLSKKQLEGLLGKATKFTDALPGKLATLEAIILKKHTNHRSVIASPAAQEAPDEQTPALIASILEKYPAHKRVLYFQLKIEKKETLTTQEKEELNKFAKLLLK